MLIKLLLSICEEFISKNYADILESILQMLYIEFRFISDFNGFNQKNLFGVFCYKLCQSARLDNI